MSLRTRGCRIGALIIQDLVLADSAATKASRASRSSSDKEEIGFDVAANRMALSRSKGVRSLTRPAISNSRRGGTPNTWANLKMADGSGEQWGSCSISKISDVSIPASLASRSGFQPLLRRQSSTNCPKAILVSMASGGGGLVYVERWVGGIPAPTSASPSISARRANHSFGYSFIMVLKCYGGTIPPGFRLTQST